MDELFAIVEVSSRRKSCNAPCVCIVVMLFGGFASAVDAAKFQGPDVALIRYKGYGVQSWRLESGTFSDVRQHDRQERQFRDLIGYKNVFVRDDLQHGGSKKGRLAFSPRIFIRPIMVIEELQAFFRPYQAQAIVFIDGNALVYVPQVVTNARIFSFILCYHQIYGVYLQILW